MLSQNILKNIKKTYVCNINIFQLLSGDECIWCKRLLYCIKNKKNKTNSKVYFSPNKKKYILKIQKAKDAIKKKYTRATIRINKLYDRLNNIRVQMKKVSDANLSQILENNNVSNCQRDLINEIFKASKLTNPKNRRYTENWILLCLLFQIR